MIYLKLKFLKFYIFKQRLLYKAEKADKKIFFIPEPYTTQGCSKCGNLYNIGKSKIYECKNCDLVCDRDVNSAKNIGMKGIIMCLGI